MGNRLFDMQDYKRLRVTTRAREVIRATYKFTSDLPRSEQFGLTSQMRRAAVSVGLNIAEGCSRSSTRELIRYLEISGGSAMELDFAILITEDLEFGREAERERLLACLTIFRRELSALIRALRLRLAERTRT